MKALFTTVLQLYVAFALLMGLTACGGDSQPRQTIENVAPNAKARVNAGGTTNVFANSIVSLDGTGSSDDNYDRLSFFWALTTKPTGSAAVIASPSSAMTTFNTDVAGLYVVSLIVNDGKLNSAPKKVTVNAVGGSTSSVVIRNPDSLLSSSTSIIQTESPQTSNNGWWVNHWNGATFNSVTEATSFGSRSAYKYARTNTQGSAMPVYDLNLSKGKRYRVEFKYKSDVGHPINFYIRKNDSYYQSIANRRVWATGRWEAMSIEFIPTEASQFSLRFGVGWINTSVYVADVTIFSIDSNEFFGGSGKLIDDNFFGMHVNKLGVHNNWPSMKPGLMRLHDTGTQWRDLETSKGVYNWGRLDYYLNYISAGKGHAMYTFSGTPRWAAATPDSSGAYGPGSNSKAIDIRDVSVFLDKLMLKYDGRISSYEVWNEPDYSPFYLGGSQDLVEITKAMIASRNKITSKPKIVGPGFTHYGISMAENYYKLCGESCPDAVAWHYYTAQNNPPEDMIADFNNLREIMKWADKESLPILNTEFGLWSSAADDTCMLPIGSGRDSATMLARSVLTMAGLGLESFSYYVWDRPGSDLCSLSTPASNFRDLTPVGVAYTEVKNWLVGATIIDSWVQFEDVYVIKLRKANKQQLVLWKSGDGEKRVHLPTTFATLTTAVNLKGEERSLSPDRYVTISRGPLLLKSD
jgi:hypothetical protein